MPEALDPPPELTLLRVLEGHQEPILRLEWSLDGTKLSSGSVDRSARLWDVNDGRTLHTLWGHSQGVNLAAWSPDGKRVATCSYDQTVRIWDAQDGREQVSRHLHEADIPTVAWSPDGILLAAACDDRTIAVCRSDNLERTATLKKHRYGVQRVRWFQRNGLFDLISCGMDNKVRFWRMIDGVAYGSLSGHRKGVIDFCFHPNRQWLASCSFDRTIRIWDIEKKKELWTLEGHTDSVRSVTFSHDGQLLASSSNDGTVRIWRTSDWQTACILKEPTSVFWPCGIAFAPHQARLATFGNYDHVIRLWDVDVAALCAKSPTAKMVTYSSAKVVLVGESGSGKSALAEVLQGMPYRNQEATHGMKIWPHRVDDTVTPEGLRIRETLLWDLAGQYDYQIVHQLFLDETSLALIVFDPNRATRFEGVGYWVRALRRLKGKVPRILVAGRVDRGGLIAGKTERDNITKEYEFLTYIATSSTAGTGIDELKDLIKNNIPWDELGVTKSPEIWNSIRDFLLRKRGERLLMKLTELKSECLPNHSLDESEEFDAVLANAQAQGLVWRLPIGGMVLLRPEMMNACASAIALAARSNDDGTGSVRESDLTEGKIRLPDLKEGDKELDKKEVKELLFAVVQLLIQKEIVFRESFPDGDRLVFPSKLNISREETPEAEITYDFDGSAEEIYATLVVRLAYSGKFKLSGRWDNCAEFQDEAGSGQVYGVLLSAPGTGRAGLSLFFIGNAPVATKRLFVVFVEEHLEKRGRERKFVREHARVCPACEQPLDGPCKDVKLVVVAPGGAALKCEYILPPTDLAKAINENSSESERNQLKEMERRIEVERRRNARDFDVFFSYNSRDRGDVLHVADSLNKSSIAVWLDLWQVFPGDTHSEKIENAISTVDTIVVFVGKPGAGPIQNWEISLALDLALRDNVRLIPVLLPGVSKQQLRTGLRPFSYIEFGSPHPYQEEIALLEKTILKAGEKRGPLPREIMSKKEVEDFVKGGLSGTYNSVAGGIPRQDWNGFDSNPNG